MLTAESTRPPTKDARERLLAAATRMFAKHGLQGATTRIIAEEAGVNEVTLFRHFQNKEGLLEATMVRVVNSHLKELVGDEADWTGDLAENLMRFGKGYYAKLVEDEEFVRTVVGEAKRHPDHARKVILEALRPTRLQFIANLVSAQNAGKIRKDVDIPTAADAFTGMLFGGMLRITAGCSEGYTGDDFVKTCVDIFASGLAPCTALNGTS